MRKYDPSRPRPARTGPPPSEVSPVEKALAAVSTLVIGAWLVANPLAVAVVMVALAVALLLVGVPLAVVRSVLRVEAAFARRDRNRAEETPRARHDLDADVPDSADRTASAE